MNLHNIFIVGAAKAGTTALYYLLSQHSEICTPVVKEPNYFSNLNNEQDVVKPGCGPGDGSTVWTNSIGAYRSLYEITEMHRFKLDASVSYLYSSEAARYISDYDSHAKIIIVLRNPVERAWSHYQHLVRDSREELSFEEALQEEEDRIQKGWEFSWHLRHMGLYSNQLQRYFRYFDQSQIRIFLFDDIKSDITRVVDETAKFIGLSPFNYDFEQKKHNVSGVSKSKALSNFVNWIVGYKATINKIVPPSVTHGLMQKFRALNTKEGVLSLNEQTRKKLGSYFKKDIQKTEHMIKRDLSGWLN